MDNLYEMAMAIVIGLLGLTFAYQLFTYSSKYDDALINEYEQKPSINYTTALYDYERTESKEQVLEDILVSEGIVKVGVTTLDEDKISKARNYNATGIQYVRSCLTRSTYEKTYLFDENGNNIGLIFK